MIKIIKPYLTCLFLFTIFMGCSTHHETILEIGEKDLSPNEFALAPNGFKQFIENDFGFEDQFFIPGYSKENDDFPYVLAGPVDIWGGTWSTSGWRTNEVNILFNVDEEEFEGQYKVVIELADHAKKFLPLVKVKFNDQSEKYQLSAEGYDLKTQLNPSQQEPYVDSASLLGDLSLATPKTLVMTVSAETLRKRGNQITITVLQGSWIMFDQIRVEGPSIDLIKPEHVFIRKVEAANYEVDIEDKACQPLLVDVEHLDGLPELSVLLDGEVIFKEILEKGRYNFEAPMPAVDAATKSKFEIRVNGKVIQEGDFTRNKQIKQTPADYVDTRIGTGHSRWMIAPGPWMPFSMVKLSPDNQNAGWQSGYQPSIESVGTFSHIHEWTLGGLGLFASNGSLKTDIGHELDPESGYRSRIDKNTEEANIGYYKVELTDYDIKAELTATTRCGFTRFTFPQDKDSARVLIDLHVPAENDYQLKEVYIKKVSDYRLEGYSHQYAPHVWYEYSNQDFTLNFVIEFDKPIKSIGHWVDDVVKYSDELKAKNIKDAGIFVQFDVADMPVVQVRSGISMVSIENAALNLETEVSKPFGWDFNAIRDEQKRVWNDLFNRVQITTTNKIEKSRFYNAMYRSICSRNTFSDVNGEWVGTDLNVQKFTNPDDVALGCDAFWNTFWNLNQFWNLVTPEWSSRWVRSQLAMYDAYDWLAKGPAGMNYIPVMVAEHEIPMIVGAYQMGIRDFDANKALKAAVKMQTTPGRIVHNGFAGNRDLKTYMEHGYVPYDQGRFSNSLEYSFDDWTVGQLAKALGNDALYDKFNKRGYWWKNVISEDGYAQMRDSKGDWAKNFDPFKSGANHHYVEGNAWQLTFFVPQDVPALIDYIGNDRFTERLDWGFKQSEPWRYNGMNDQYWDYPVMQGNQQSMHFAYLFNWSGKPWLTQKWSRSIIDRYYGSGINNAYLGDEDQGQMSAWFVMSAMGLFQTNGGTSVEPFYELTSPLYEKIEINLGERYGRGGKFTIKANNTSSINKYIQSAILNGEELNSFKFPAKKLLQGGELILEMGSEPNKSWGVDGSR